MRAIKFCENGILNHSEAAEIKKHRTAKLSTRKKVGLYLIKLFESCLHTKYWNLISAEKRRLVKLIDGTKERMDGYLNLISFSR